MYSLTDLCSLCLMNSKSIKSISSRDKDGILIKNKLEFVVYEVINFKSDTVKNICTDCLKGLNYVYKFKQKCLQNLTSLNDFIEKMTVEESEEFHYFVSEQIQNETTTGNHFLYNISDDSEGKDESMETNNSCKNQNKNTVLENFVKEEPEYIYDDCEMQYNSGFEESCTESENQTSNTDCSITTNSVYIKQTNESYENQFTENNKEIENIKIEPEYLIRNDESDNIKYDSLLSEDENSRDTPNEATNKSEDSTPLAGLPEKSKERYEHVYTQFENWCQEKNVQLINEELLLTYFHEKSRLLKSSTLWSIFSMLRATLSVKKNIDIKKYSNLTGFIKKKSIGHQSKSSSILTKSEIEKFLKEADDSTYLLMKVVLIIGISGACRREELTYLQLESIKDMGPFILIELPNNLKTNVRKEFIISTGSIEGLDLVKIFKKYASLRPARTENTRFFLGYRSGKCTRQSVGINTIGAIPKRIAEFLKLSNPSSYTGNCFRRTASTLLTDTGGNIVTVKRRGRWK